MLTLGEQHVAEVGLADQIALEHVDAKALPYPDQSFDGVISNSIIHHLPNPMAAFRKSVV